MKKMNLKSLTPIRLASEASVRLVIGGVLLLLLILVGLEAKATPARILIIRHAEKPTDPSDQNLSPQGYQRAQALTQLFQIHPEYATPGLPVAYFATAFNGNNANRAAETVTPLAQKYGLTVLQPEASSNTDDLAQIIMSNPDYNGKLVMIAWVHEKLPALAQSLGATTAPAAWDGKNIFDRVWILDYTSNGLQFSDMPESVMPGDSH